MLNSSDDLPVAAMVNLQLGWNRPLNTLNICTENLRSTFTPEMASSSYEHGMKIWSDKVPAGFRKSTHIVLG